MAMVRVPALERTRFGLSYEFVGPLVFALMSTIGFLVVRPPVGDLMAASTRTR
ncbi:hypothetical protein [Leekyejoonella antrihumi]|uniref:hypothetical protein n=1 Tax=Leekyejoonella antrihumi TaxID=1660198 RepID=UPI001647005A|nr:hypothetical protein [Leekyejoonella antrihumi]